jgi:Family of unknown function (DUF5313)
MTAAKPNLWQYIGYSYGRLLPASMRSWVARDLAGAGAIRRHMIRWAIPPVLLITPLWLLPASPYVHRAALLLGAADIACPEQSLAPAPAG